MNSIVSLLNETKHCYLETTADISQLADELRFLLTDDVHMLDEQTQKQIATLIEQVTCDAIRNQRTLLQLAALHNKLDPPWHMVKKHSHLRRVK